MEKFPLYFPRLRLHLKFPRSRRPLLHLQLPVQMLTGPVRLAVRPCLPPPAFAAIAGAEKMVPPKIQPTPVFCAAASSSFPGTGSVPTCNRPEPADANFCRSCGRALGASPQPTGNRSRPPMPAAVGTGSQLLPDVWLQGRKTANWSENTRHAPSPAWRCTCFPNSTRVRGPPSMPDSGGEPLPDPRFRPPGPCHRRLLVITFRGLPSRP